MSDYSPQIEPYAAAIRKLLQGVVYHDDPVWSQIRDYELAVRDYLGRIGLHIYLDEIGGFAYLTDESRDDDSLDSLPALTTRRSLSFIDTLLLVLLRERLDEHEMRDIDGNRLMLTADEMTEMLIVFLGDHPDARKVESNITTTINRLVRYGFLSSGKHNRYTVRPVLRAKISADELDHVKTRLADYVQSNNDASDDHDNNEFIR
jgi:hypothetical protein